MEEMSLDDDVDIEKLAKKTDGYSGADIAAVCRKAGMLALHDNIESKSVSPKHFKKALKKIGPSLTSEVMKYYKRLTKELERGIEVRKEREEIPREVA